MTFSLISLIFTEMPGTSKFLPTVPRFY
uniref:Uncharacterized protein n=1 Tax=Rhizophora mucronata TaxID=61149 RepID=A0A2P2MZ97_RHIMU